MSSSAGKTRQYPVVCPKCTEEKGFPYQVRTMGDHGSIEVKLRCRGCNYEWTDIVISKD